MTVSIQVQLVGAVIQGDQILVEELIQNGANVHEPALGHQTFLELAIQCNRFKVAEVLVHHVDIYACDYLRYAVSHGRADILDLLLRHVTCMDLTALLYSAAMQGKLNVVKVLLNHGARLGPETSSILETIKKRGHDDVWHEQDGTSSNSINQPSHVL